MASTTILDSGLPGNRRSGANSNRRPGVPAYLEQVVYVSEGGRHRPGDTWIIDRDRPHDPLDPGTYGSPGWYADNRTGRHRRGELPDPPSEEPPSRPPSPTRRRFREEDEDRRYDFGRLREEAWSRFLVESWDLHTAHLIKRPNPMDRWVRLWRAMRTFILRVLGLRSDTDTELLTAPIARVAPAVRATASSRPEAPALLAGTPFQGEPRPNPISPYIAQWERHFDERQAFREAVVL